MTYYHFSQHHLGKKKKKENSNSFFLFSLDAGHTGKKSGADYCATLRLISP